MRVMMIRAIGATVVSALMTVAPGAAHAQGTVPELVGRVWTASDAAAAPGSLKIFLRDGTLVMTSCVETYRVARWWQITRTRLAWEEDAARIEADVVQVTPTTLQLRLHLRSEARMENYSAAAVPATCTGDTAAKRRDAVIASGSVVYMERVALPPTARIRVELRDDSRGDAAARPLAVQTLSAKDGPPFRFVLEAPQDRLDDRTRLSVFAEIRDGDRVLFTTRHRTAVPAAGAGNLEIRLTFVSSPRSTPAPGVIMPAPSAYRCGDEVFRVAFETGRAYVTMPDRSVVTLPRSGAGRARDTTRTFTNGRITFTQAIGGSVAGSVRFARGRRASVSCTPAS